MADFFVISRSDDSSLAEVRLVEGDLAREWHGGSKMWFQSESWWALVNDVLPEASQEDQVSVSLLSDEFKSLIDMAAETIEEEVSDEADVSEALVERSHFLKSAARLIELAAGEKGWFLGGVV